MIRIQQKVTRWLGDSLVSVKAFSDDAKREAGHQLGRVQEGQEPTDWKPMETVGAGVREIRIREGGKYKCTRIVIASVARQSMPLARDHGSPRYARDDE